MAGHEWDDWFEREEFIGQISDIRVQNLQAERESIQKRTFTRWMNLHLEKCNPPLEITDLFSEIRDGRILMALLEELSGCKLLHEFKPSSHRIFRLNNIAKVLTFLEERNVKLISIDAADVADGNSSLVLGLIWNIILFFQIKELTGTIQSRFSSTSSLSSQPNSTDSDTSHPGTPAEDKPTSVSRREHGKAIRTLLHWVQKRTAKYGVVVQDFGKSWTSGLAFLAVIKSIDSSLVDMQKARLRTPRQNIEDAFKIAHYSLGIPRLLETEDVMISTPDEQSIMTYVSQFLEHFPGYDQEEPFEKTERSFPASTVSTRQSHGPANGLHRERCRPYVARKDSVPPPPKIFVSSVPDDFEQPCSADEDVVGDTKTVKDEHKEESSESPRRPPDLGKEGVAQSPKLSCVDSAIGSPDSWSEVTSEVGLLDSPGLFNDSTNPSSPDELQESKAREPSSKMNKASEDEVFQNLFIEDGNVSQSSLDNFQTNSKFSLEEEDAYQYILDLNNKRDSCSLPGPCDQQEDSLDGPASEQMDLSLTQSHYRAHPPKKEKNEFQPPSELGEISPSQTKSTSKHSFQVVCVATQKAETHVDSLSGVNKPETTLHHSGNFSGLSPEMFGMEMEGYNQQSDYKSTGIDFANMFSQDKNRSECQFEMHGKNQIVDCAAIAFVDQEPVTCMSAQEENHKENHLASVSEDQKYSGYQSMAQDKNHIQDRTSSLSEDQKDDSQSNVHGCWSEDSVTAVSQGHSGFQFKEQDKDQNLDSSGSLFEDNDYPFDLLKEKEQQNHLSFITDDTGLMHEGVEGTVERDQTKENEDQSVSDITETQESIYVAKPYHSDTSLRGRDSLGDLNIGALGRNEPSRMSAESPHSFTLGETNDNLFDYNKPCNMSYRMYEDIVEETDLMAGTVHRDADRSYLLSMDNVQENSIEDSDTLPVLDSSSGISYKGYEEQTNKVQLGTSTHHCAVRQYESVGAEDDPCPLSYPKASQKSLMTTPRPEQQTTVTAAPSSDISVAELHLLLLLWLLLYCLFVLPQLDLCALPRLLLNFEE